MDLGSNNLLHKHLRKSCESLATKVAQTATQEVQSVTKIKAPETSEAPQAERFPACPEVVPSNATDVYEEGYTFRGHRFVTAVVMFFLAGLGYELCFNTGCTMSLVDREYLLKTVPGISIKKMASPMTVRGFGTNTHDASEFVCLKSYLPSEDGQGVALIETEFHIVDNLTAKVLIGIDIIKPQGGILDVARSLMTISSCNDIKLPITSASHRPQTNATVLSNKRMTIPAHSNVGVPISGPKHRRLGLPADRDFIFEPQKLDLPSVYAYVIDHKASEIFVRNDTDRAIQLPRRVKLGMISDYEAARCFQIDSSRHDKSQNWIKLGLRKLVAAAAAFTAAMAPVATEEHMLLASQSTNPRKPGPQSLPR